MGDILQISNNPWLLSIAAVILLAIVWIVVRLVRGRDGDFERAVADISFDRIDGLVIPKADEGEILVDYLLLTSQGLLILELKDVQGTVFGGDKLQDWTVINKQRRYTFSNPQPALYDRIAAVRQIVREVPVAGRILFLDGAEFAKGTPGLVSTLAQLVSEFGEPDKKAAKFKIEAFKPHWELIRKEALSTQSP
ncbi:MAG: hypothetical protein GWP67_02015 [Gammaproteobacteria bacterium]|jgi:hypothetical protein|nr:hypothetical protein [Gammaproteobacteria bacterium]